MASNLEENAQDFVLETRQIKIEESPFAFNPSIVKWRGNILMSYREISNPLPTPYSAGYSHIFIIRLDENFSPVGKPIRLLGAKETFSRCEDARLIVVGEELYAIYSDHLEETIRDGGFRVFVARLSDEGDTIRVISTECLSTFEGENLNKREKNWTPFDYEGTLLLSYTLKPHKIFYPLLDGSGICKTYVTTFPSIVWEWGELRGGTQALRINEDEYLAFFHSCLPLASFHSNYETLLHYFMGAYLFSRDPPFEIKKISPEPIIGKNFYCGKEYEPYWNPVRVVFPCGFIEDTDFVWISYGRQDHEIWIAKLEKKGLLESLIQVSTLPTQSNR